MSRKPKPKFEVTEWTHDGKRPLRLYIVGAHSVGKTTIARWVSKTYRLPLVNEVARAVLAEKELSLDLLRTDIELTAEFQAEVFRRQAGAEDAAGMRFVSDRAFDNLAYAGSHTLALHKIIGGTASYVERLKSPGSIIFLVKPHPALMAQDGTRERGEWEEIVRIDAMVRMLLELNDIDYVVIESSKMPERARTIRAVLRAAGVLPVA